jgi:ribosome-binding ATPase YchF (GTP1/OBG family)
VALEVGIVGPPGSGTTSLFTALTKAGGGEYGKTNVGVAPIADERLGALARVVSARKVTPATIRVQDVPGSGAALLGNLRQVDALLVVLRGFGPDPDPAGDLETFRLELLVADRDHVERRLERVEKQAKSGDPRLRAEVDELRKVLAHVDAGASLADYPGRLPRELEPLTTKPVLAVENGPGGIDLKLEAELAELPDEEAAAFRDGGTSALDDVAARLADALALITFFTAGEKETRADGARRRRGDPLGHRARLHPLRGRRLARPRRGGLARRGREARPPAARGQDLCRPGRRRPEHPLQRLTTRTRRS